MTPTKEVSRQRPLRRRTTHDSELSAPAAKTMSSAFAKLNLQNQSVVSMNMSNSKLNQLTMTMQQEREILQNLKDLWDLDQQCEAQLSSTIRISSYHDPERVYQRTGLSRKEENHSSGERKQVFLHRFRQHAECFPHGPN
ncbi:hypothetical protein ILUMI_25782 [Ignelater luminosus]|uniref:Uncharacterized protein n=1 Tax=Ignelater luminosus TaxID=2038154 RepID=A0A8K0C6U8_IGNLU|nr:hypothetical protein ILUMI_25782 [Ignelater luminosus]